MNDKNCLLDKKILISAGGTGGHVYPALTLALNLKNLGAEIHWIGTDAGIESKLLTGHPVKLHKIFVQGVRGNGIKRLLKSPFIIIKAIIESRNIFKEIKPDVYIGFGGFVSGPSGLSAKLTKTPVILHEQNAAMGLTNRIVSKWAKKVLFAFPIEGRKGKVVGNPIRKNITEIVDIKHRIMTTEKIRILVVGGSQGARKINDTVPFALELMNRLDIEITHQAGDKTFTATKENYERAGVIGKVVTYIDDMDLAYSESDLVIARSGALTVSEVASVGIAAIYIPLPYAVDNHQYLNAKFIENNNGAIIIEEKELSAEKLAIIIEDLIDNNKLLQMAEKSKEMSHKDALDNITKEVIEVLNVK